MLVKDLVRQLAIADDNGYSFEKVFFCDENGDNIEVNSYVIKNDRLCLMYRSSEGLGFDVKNLLGILRFFRGNTRVYFEDNFNDVCYKILRKNLPDEMDYFDENDEDNWIWYCNDYNEIFFDVETISGDDDFDDGDEGVFDEDDDD